MSKFKTHEENIDQLFLSIEAQCSLSEGTGVSKIFGRSKAWKAGGQEVMESLADGVKRFPMVAVERGRQLQLCPDRLGWCEGDGGCCAGHQFLSG